MNEAIVKTTREITLKAGQMLSEMAVAIARERSIDIAVSVVDRSGYLVSFARMDAAPIVSVSVSEGKARTAAMIRAPSKLFEDMINSGSPSMATVPHLLPLQGGMPLILGQEVVGAIGISGSTGENDQAVATMVAERFSAAEIRLN